MNYLFIFAIEGQPHGWMDACLLKHRHEELIAPQYLSANDKFFVAIVHPVD